MLKQIQVFLVALSLLGFCLPKGVQFRRAIPPASPSPNNSGIPPGQHPEWSYLNPIEWWKTDPTQRDHARYHACLSMAAYADYEATCPSTFTQGFTVLEKFGTDNGQYGFVAEIIQMQKVVIVFKGLDNIDSIDMTPESIEDFVSECSGCRSAKGIKALYLAARSQTNNWQIAKTRVSQTGLKFSVTGHGSGGAVAILAALDLGSQNWVHYSHNQGVFPSLNSVAVYRHDDLFQVLAGQSLIAENDYMVQLQPNPAEPYYHVGSRVKILGDKQQYLVNCYGNNENVTCNGNGSNRKIHDFYFTPKGSCCDATNGL